MSSALAACRLMALLLLVGKAFAVPASDMADAIEMHSPDAAPAVSEPATPVPQRMEDMAAYLGAVRTHVESNPALAAAYMVFWSELTAGARSSLQVNDEAARYAAIADIALQVSRSVAGPVSANNSSPGLTDLLQQTLHTLAGSSANTGQANGLTPPDVAERLLTNLQPVIVPYVNPEGRYETAGTLPPLASLGTSGDVWNMCRAIPACVESHDRLFAPAMNGISLIADVQKRVQGDLALSQSPLWQGMQPLAQSLDGALANKTTPEQRIAALKRLSNEQWKAAMTILPLAAGITNTSAQPGQPTADGNSLDALFTIGQASAQLAGSERLARAFATTRSPALDFASVASQSALSGTFATSVAGVALLVAGVQALSFLDDDASEIQASNELRQLIKALDARTYAAIADARTEQLLAINTVDTRVAELGLALDVVKTDVARLETASRRRVAAAAETSNARRWSDFDAANDRCFSLRRRDHKTKLLSAADFRWCEDRFLQGATIKSRYSNRSTEYSLDARFIDAGTPVFPFHQHYPLLFAQSGLDSRSVLALPDPLDWQQNSAALLRLYQEHPVKAGEQFKRHETLQAVVLAGNRIRTALNGLIVHSGGRGKPVFRKDLHEQAMQRYQQALQKLADRVAKLDDPAAHPFGKRMTVGLAQTFASGGKRAAIEAQLSRNILKKGGLQVCPDIGSGEFMAQQDGLVAESRRFFGNPITPEELAKAWNREMVEAQRLELDALSSLIPEPFVWASLDGLGSLQVCVSRLRPQYLAFTLEDGSQPDTNLGAITIAADIEIRFLPSESIAPTLGLSADEPVLVAKRSAERSCTFAYRNDEKGCSRAQCLREIAPTLWGTDKNTAAEHVSCPEISLRDKLMAAQTNSSEEVATVMARLEPLYWERQRERLARIEADALRSDEFDAASTQFLQYYALAGVTLGPYPESTKLLDGMFGETSPLTPRNALLNFINSRQPVDVQLTELRESGNAVLAQVRKRGKEIQDPLMLRRLPPLAALDDMTTRIELLDSVYRPDN